MEVLTRKIGPLPGWAWGGLALAAALAFWYLRGRSSTSSSGTTGSLVNNPAASTVPYVPSVTVTGIPQGSSTPTSPQPLGGSAGTVTIRGNWPSGTVALWPTPGVTIPVTQVPDGTALPSAGAPVQGGSFNGHNIQSNWWQPVTYSGAKLYVWAVDTQASGGQGGWGYAGGSAPASALGGWTIGWFPSAAAGPGFAAAGGEGGGTSNRTRAARGRLAPRLLAGQGGGGRSRGTRTRNLRRRDLSGR